MADVQPLQGIRYSRDTVGDLAQVVTPPYDVISEEDQARYYARSPYNIIRLELGKEEPGDTSLNNRYTRAAAIFCDKRLPPATTCTNRYLIMRVKRILARVCWRGCDWNHGAQKLCYPTRQH